MVIRICDARKAATDRYNPMMPATAMRDEVGKQKATVTDVDLISQTRRSAAGMKSLVVTLAFVFLLVVAMLLDIVYLYIMAVALAMIQPVAYLVAVRFTPRYTVRRNLPPVGVEGRSVEIRLDVSSAGGLPQGALHIMDRVPTGFTTTTPPAELGCLQQWDGITGHLSYLALPSLRGVYTFDQATMDSSDPIGLYFFETTLDGANEIVVHPASALAPNLTNGQLGARGQEEQDGSIRRGEGVDLHGVREYVPGDSLRRVHWRASARRDKLVVVEYEDALPQDMQLILMGTTANHRGAGRQSTFEVSIKVAATLSDRVQRDGGAFSISCGPTLCSAPNKGDSRRARFALLEWLARLDVPGTEQYPKPTSRTNASRTRTVVVTPAITASVLRCIADVRRGGVATEIILLSEGSTPDRCGLANIPAGIRVRIVDDKANPWVDGGRRFVRAIGAT
jgi:uncharacterized protein (DUF58 family)